MTSPSARPASSGALLTVVVLCFGGLSAALTQTLVIPLQARLPELLGTSVTGAGWVVTVTLLAGGISMPISGRLGDLYGKQRVLMGTTGLLVVGSVVSALSSTLAPMLAGRALQGMAMGFIPVGIALMRDVTPPRLTNSGIAAMSATLGVGGAIGLPLSAWVAQTFDWHALFWMSGGLAVVLLVAVAVFVPHVNETQDARFDLVGAVGLSLGLVAALVAVSQGHNWGWTSGRTLGLFVTGVVVLLAWGRYELGASDPLCDLRATARTPVLLTNLAAVAVGFGMMAQAIVVPQLLELPTATGFGMGQSIIATGLWLAPGGLVMMAFAPISGRLMTDVGPKRTLMLGAGVLGVGYLVAFFLMDAPWQLLVASSVISAGVGIGYAAMPTLIMSAVAIREAGSAVGINALMRSLGTTSAAAVMTTVLASNTVPFGDAVVPDRGAYQLCFLIGAIAAFVGVAITALVPHLHTRPTAAPSFEGVPAGAEAAEVPATRA